MSTLVVDGEEVPLDDAWREALVLQPVPPPVPAEVSRAQGQIAMLRHILADGRSLLTAVRQHVAAAVAATDNLPDGDPDRIAALEAGIWFEGASVYRRDHPLILSLPAALGVELTEAAIDNLFHAAAAV